MKLPLCNSLSNASGKRCKKTSPNNAPTAKLKKIFKVLPFSATRKIKKLVHFACACVQIVRTFMNCNDLLFLTCVYALVEEKNISTA